MPVSVHVRGAVEPTGRPRGGGGAGVRAPAQGRRRAQHLARRQRPACACGAVSSRRAHPWLADVAELCPRPSERTGGALHAPGLPRRRPAGYDPTGLVKGWAVAGAAAHLDNVPGDLLLHQRRRRPRRGAGTVGRGAVVAHRHRGPAPTGRRGRRRRRCDAAPSRRRCGGPWRPRRRPAYRCADHRPGRPRWSGPSLLWADVWATAPVGRPRRRANGPAATDPAYRSLVL